MSFLKIGFVLDDTLDKPDGVQQYVLRLGEWMAAQGHEVHYLVGQSARKDIPNLHSLARNVGVTFNKNHLSVPLPARKRAIIALLKRENFDILHVQMPFSPFLAGRIIKYASPRTTVIGTFHILPYSLLEKWATHVLGRIVRTSLRRFSTILAVSSPARKFAQDSFKIEAEVLPNTINLPWYRAGSKPRSTSSTTTITFLGRLVRRKGALQLLQAVAALPTSIQSRIVIRIGGKGPLLDELKQYAQETHIADRVHFDGFVPEENKPAYLSQADIAVFPATGGESFGIVLLEAMASGAGVTIGGRNPGYASVLSSWPETLFEPRNTAEFANVLQRMITNKTLTRSLHQKQSRAVEQYSVDNVGSRLIGIYQNAIAKNKLKQHNTK